MEFCMSQCQVSVAAGQRQTSQQKIVWTSEKSGINFAQHQMAVVFVLVLVEDYQFEAGLNDD